MCVRGVYSLNKHCVAIYRSISTRFSAFFSHNGLVFQMHYIVLIFVARWSHNFCEIAVKIVKTPKNYGKVCAHHFVKIAERFKISFIVVVKSRVSK